MEKAQITFAEFMTEKMYTESFLFKISEIKSLKKGIKETRKSLDRGYQIDHAGKKYDWNDIFRSNPNGEGMVRAYEQKKNGLPLNRNGYDMRKKRFRWRKRRFADIGMNIWNMRNQKI